MLLFCVSFEYPERSRLNYVRSTEQSENENDLMDVAGNSIFFHPFRLWSPLLLERFVSGIGMSSTEPNRLCGGLNREKHEIIEAKDFVFKFVYDTR